MQLVLFLFMVLSSPAKAVISLPEFTPNIIDLTESLGEQDRRAINQQIVSLQDSVDMKAAVFMVDSLDGESIEALAVRSFKFWKLGEKGKDNGLLLVLSLKDRKSRIEVGYGLEGEITDLISKRALDEYLRPAFRRNEYREGIQDTLNFLSSRLKGGDKIILKKKPSLFDQVYGLGLYLWLTFVAFLWGIGPILKNMAKKRTSNLARILPDHPELKLTKDEQKLIEDSNTTKSIGLLKAFLTLNPGIFVFIFGNILGNTGTILSQSLVTGAGLGILSVVFVLFEARIRHLRSLESFKIYLSRLRAKNRLLVDQGFMTEDSEGNFTYTRKYFASSNSSGSSSDSSSFSSSGDSGSSSSSSDGGSSGGGGASSDW